MHQVMRGIFLSGLDNQLFAQPLLILFAYGFCPSHSRGL